MTRIFRKYIGKFVYVYLNDIFIYSYAIEEHEEHFYKGLTYLELSSST